ncbi:MAG: hypothetical protein QOH72_640 [Solirubrobacteraceae bacterium]|jgi:hypothetical protein|nr:hypothetical protein [Solirubrobacteraceae bacterium]
MLRICLVLAAAAALALPAAATAQTVATPGAPTAVKEFAGNLVFSQFDPATNQYFLTVRRARAAAPERLPVAPSARTFDADIGPNSSGRPELIYQRCSPPPGVPTGCDLFVLALDGTSAERPVRNANDPDHNDTNATIWRGRIVWARDYGSGSTPNPIVYTKALAAPRGRPSTRLPGVPQRRTGDVDPRVSGPTTGRTVQDLELWGQNLALTVSYGCGGCSGIDQSELRLDDLGDGSARRIAFQVVGLSGQTLVGPSFFAGRLGWYKACLGDPGGCQQGQGGPFRYALTAGTYQRGTPGPVRVDGFADTGTLLYEAVGCSDETQGSFNANCRIDTVTPPPYAPTRAPVR